MAKCFCGCGRRVAFNRRPTNKTGTLLRDSLSELEADFERPDLAEFRDESIDSFLGEGHQYVEALSEITHQDAQPAAFDVDGMRAWLHTAWAAHGENLGILEGVTEGMTALEARSLVRMGRWARESGLSLEQARAEIVRRLDVGEQLPW